jgi:hypothetical protein
MKPGDRVGERFLVEALAGQGAMGIVYRARDLTTGDAVAVKVLTGGRTATERFLREIDIVALLHHPRIVRYVAHGVAPDGAPFLAMEWLEGETLEDRLARSSVSVIESIDVARAIAEALVAAHAIGIVHRDLKPANVVLLHGFVDSVKVVDFGVARIGSDGPVLTGTGEIVGTPAYMSPEQALSKKDIDGRSDLFSLGSILYRCIAGKYPFAAETPLRVLLKLINERAAPLASVAPGAPGKVAALVDAMLATDPNERPQTALAVHSALSNVRSELARTAVALPATPVTPKTVPSADVVQPKAKATAPKLGRLYFAIFAVGAGALVLLVGAGLWIFTLGPLSAHSSKPMKAPSPVNRDCPANARACEPLDLKDPSKVDPMQLSVKAVNVGKTYGGGELFEIRAVGLSERGIDVTSGGKIGFYVTHGIVIVTDGQQFVVNASNLEDEPPVTWAEDCGLEQAYEVAAHAGLSRTRAWQMRVVKKSKSRPQYIFSAPLGDGLERAIAIDATNCTSVLNHRREEDDGE